MHPNISLAILIHDIIGTAIRLIQGFTLEGPLPSPTLLWGGLVLLVQSTSQVYDEQKQCMHHASIMHIHATLIYL